jgi:CBS domain-containing protein
VVAPNEAVREAARRMREADVGTLIVVDAKQNPIGVITDRDVALRCVAEDRDPDQTPVSAVMTAPMLCVAEATPIEEALRRMAGVGARRLGVTDADGRLAGILALDDVLELLVEEAEAIGRLLQRRHPPLEA